MKALLKRTLRRVQDAWRTTFAPLPPVITVVPELDRRQHGSRPHDGAPRRRADDLFLLLQEHEGAGPVFRCRNGVHAAVTGIDYSAGTPVSGYICLEVAWGTVHYDLGWYFDGGFSHTGKPHPWDIVDLVSAETERGGRPTLSVVSGGAAL